ncbi:GAP family protein [Curtobacterium sp. MCBD17_032]|uniref:GAP family protein n=1 Tax=Curtobacterium sp. MCBD17_032 TaxID=2175659 RepID=UPI0015E8BBF8|nr:GAP family protein [Curtobacterium sp. MCBD17_032]
MDVAALVPAVVGIALSPLVVASVVFLLGHRGGLAPAAACASGWILSVAAALVVAVSLGERLPSPAEGETDVRAVVEVVAGVVLLGLAVWQWVVRRLPDGRPRSTGWADAVGAIGPVRAFLIGVAWFLTNPKALVLSLTAGLVVGEADPSLGTLAWIGTGYVLVSGSTALLPIAVAAALGPRADRPLTVVRRAIARWGSLALVVVLTVLGLVQLVAGVLALR